MNTNLYLYLYICANRHPKVMTRYRYLVLAPTRAAAIKEMANADGGMNEYCVIESCEQEHSVESGVWYLPLNEQEPITD